jgi:GNAT superfamily N-acetyltransferase
MRDGDKTVTAWDEGVLDARAAIAADWSMALKRPPNIRPATVEDATSLAALIRLAFASQTVVTDPLPSALKESGENLRAHFAAGGGGVVAEGPVACLLWSEKDGGLYVGRVAVHPDARGQGLAKRMLAAAEDEARRRRLPRLHLSTRLVLLDNRRLFATCGFVEIAEHAHPGYAHPTFVDMEKRL